jgi:hypothetical protein
VADVQPVGTGEPALKYLAAYVYRTALSAQRIVSHDAEHITFSFRDNTGRHQTATLSPESFLHRFLQHVFAAWLSAPPLFRLPQRCCQDQMAAGPGAPGLDPAAFENGTAHSSPDVSDLQKAHAPHRRARPLTPTPSSMNHPPRSLNRAQHKTSASVLAPLLSPLSRGFQNTDFAPRVGAFLHRQLAYSTPRRTQKTDIVSFQIKIPSRPEPATHKAKGKGAPPGSFNP